jgi:DNA invertase Pin-like site-specific DNA recombinase
MEKSIIYIRTSTEEQNPENQLELCKKLADKLNINNYDILEDRISGWKDLQRENFDKIYKEVIRGNLNNIIVWDVDRLYRNRKRMVSFFALCKVNHCKIYSARQTWLENINNMPEPFNEIMHDLMLQIMGWLAEEESNKKSDRVKAAVRKKDGKKTTSYNGKKWGRPSIHTNKKKIVWGLRNDGLSIRAIAKSTNLSVGKVSELCSEKHTP